MGLGDWFKDNWISAALGIGSAAAGLGSNALSYHQNKELMEKQQQFQERMSNTALQRGIADAKQAGINPIIVAGNGGASTPTTGLNSAQQTDFTNGISTALQTQSNIKLQDANAQLANEQSGTEQTQQALNIAKTIEQEGINKYLDKQQQEQIKKLSAETLNLNSNSAYMRAKQAAITSEIDLNSAMALKNREEAKFTNERERSHTGTKWTVGPISFGHDGPTKQYHYETENINGKKVKVKIYH